MNVSNEVFSSSISIKVLVSHITVSDKLTNNDKIYILDKVETILSQYVDKIED